MNGECSRGGLWGSLGTSSPSAASSSPSHRLAELLPAPAERLSRVPSDSGHHANAPRGCISCECQAESVTRRGAGGDPPAAGDVVTRRSPICRCLSLPGPYNILPSTNRGSCNVRARAGGRPARGGSCPAGAHWLRPLSHGWPLAGSGYLQTLSPADRWPNDITHSLLF